MKKKYTLNDPGYELDSYVHEEVNLNSGFSGGAADRVPRGIEVEENRIFFYCPVGEYEALELNRMVRRLDVEMQYLSNRLGSKTIPIHLHIHSPGGSIFAGLSAYDTLKNTKTPVYTYVEGSAASAATLISLGGKKRHIAKNGFMLIHQQQLEWAGKLDDFMDEVENQKELTERLREIYLVETKMQEKELDDLLKRELWLNSEVCLNVGLVDVVC